jgi:hypothetical protein
MKQTLITPAAARSAVRDSAFRLSIWHAGRGVQRWVFFAKSFSFNEEKLFSCSFVPTGKGRSGMILHEIPCHGKDIRKTQ